MGWIYSKAKREGEIGKIRWGQIILLSFPKIQGASRS
jgi:hypothetical protein